MIPTNTIDDLIFLKRLFEDKDTKIYTIEDITTREVKIELSISLEKSDYLEMINF